MSWRSHVIYESRDTHMNSSWHAHRWARACCAERAKEGGSVEEQQINCVRFEWVVSRISKVTSTHEFARACCAECAKEGHSVEEQQIDCGTFERVVSHMSQVTHESCHTYEWVMSYTWRSHVTNMNESCHAYKRALSHTRVSSRVPAVRSARTREIPSRSSRLIVTCDWVMSRMSKITHTHESCHEWTNRITYETSLDKRCLDKSSWQACHIRD